MSTEREQELLNALEGLYGLVETGELVRGISEDHRPDWCTRMLSFVAKLQAAQKAIKHAYGEGE